MAATPPTSSQMRRVPVRPTGVTILALLAALAGAFAAVVGAAIVAASALLGSMGVGVDAFMAGVASILGIAISLFFFIYAAFAFAVAFGLLRQHRWAWYAVAVIILIQLVQAVGTFVSGALVTGLAALALAGFLGWYLLSPPVQAYFGVSYHTPWTYRQGGRPA